MNPKLAALTLIAFVCWLVPIKTLAQETYKPKSKVETKAGPIIIYEKKVTSTNNDLHPKTLQVRQEKPKPNVRALAKPETSSTYSGRHYPETCEPYRETVSKYFGVHTDQALFVASKESGCKQGEPPSSTSDYCLFQINKEPTTNTDLDLCIRRAWEKFVAGRVGENNWSAWYAVCTPGNNPQPKYPNIKCQ